MDSQKPIFTFLICFLCYLMGGTVSTLMSVYLPVAIPDLLGIGTSEVQIGDIGSYLIAIFIFGWMVGGFVFGMISDKIGRVKTLATAVTLYGIFTISVVFVQSWQQLLVYRFFAGMGVGGVLLLCTVYISEIWETKTKPIFVGILAVAFPFGIVLAGSLNNIVQNWKSAFWIGLLPIVFAVIIILVFKESEQWLISKNKSKAVVNQLFNVGNRTSLLFGSIIFGSVLIGLWGIFMWLPTWVQSMLSGVSDSQNKRGFTMMILGGGAVFGGMFSGKLIQIFGAKRTLIYTFLGCVVGCGILFLTNSTFSNIVFVEIGFLALFFGISQGALSAYIPNLFPPNIRATATGFCFNIARFFTAAAVFFVGSLVAFFGGYSNALLSFSVFFVFAIIATFFSEDAAIE
ncbi:MAG: MFS transporter [Bacteroidota bacterium]